MPNKYKLEIVFYTEDDEETVKENFKEIVKEDEEVEDASIEKVEADN